LWILVGLVTGWLSGEITHGRGFGGLLGYIVIAILGAILGGWLFTLLGTSDSLNNILFSLLASFGGAVVLLVLIGLIRRPNLP
jgi:uncharacterized membrane protein YeaQ/YmgE (transglycosylase-associated protein family)